MNSHPSNDSISRSDFDDKSNALELRIFELDTRLTNTASYWSSRTGEDAGDLKGEMLTAICQMTAHCPNFLSKNNTYIVNAARNQMLKTVRRQWPQGGHISLNENDLDELVGGPAIDDYALSPTLLMDGLSDDLRELVQAIIKAGDDVLKRSGTLNITALAQRIGKPQRTVNRQVHQLRALLRTSPALAV